MLCSVRKKELITIPVMSTVYTLKVYMSVGRGDTYQKGFTFKHLICILNDDS